MISNPKDHVLYQHVAALLRVKACAESLLDQFSAEEYGCEERDLANALKDPAILGGSDQLLMMLVTEILLFCLPGEPILTPTIGIQTMVDDKKNVSLGIVLEIRPGKNAVGIMTRQGAEDFEKNFTAGLNKIYGRLIKL